ncbi:ankyrin repeat-containing protein NPR4-like [Salvia divinorum]|uniref:Ankyrin repeat-containing protein NPR4-like n=1 Tax=Salvia divinorum TaxID=28513 RepID=A0ABD1GCL2_SALDI
MGKTAVQILHESPPTTVDYVEMKTLLKYESDLLISQLIPEMSNTIMVVVVLIATMAFQSAITPAGGVWAEDDPKSSRRAGEAVLASTHPGLYMSIRLANTTAFLCSLAEMYLFTFRVQLANYTFSFLMVSILAMGASLLAIMFAFLSSMDAITPYEVSRPTGKRTMGVLFLCGVAWACVVYVKHLYRSWLGKKSRQIYLGADALHRRVLYWIFEQLESRGYLVDGEFEIL